MAKKRALIRPTEHTVEILGRRYAVSDMVAASVMVSTIRDSSGMGASEMGSQFPIRADGVVVGYVSYNGKVWKGRPHGLKSQKLVYDPYKANPKKCGCSPLQCYTFCGCRCHGKRR